MASNLPDSHFASLSQLETGYWWYVARVTWAKRLIGEWFERQTERPQTYADLGCGTGGFARAVQESYSFSQVTLVDSDPGAISRIHFPQAKIQVDELGTRLKLHPTPSLITMMDVLEHLKEDRRFVEHVAELLAPRGLMVVTVPAHPILFSSWDTHLGHQRRYTKKNLRDLFSVRGLKITHLRPMWTPLFPIGFLRKFKSHSPDALEFPPVSPLLNSGLITLSNWEFRLPHWARLPFGTSWILTAEKL